MSSSLSKLTESPRKLLDKYVPKDNQLLVLGTTAALGTYFLVRGCANAISTKSRVDSYKAAGSLKLEQVSTKPHPLSEAFISSHRKDLLTDSIRSKIINDLSAIDIRNAIINGEFTCQQVCAVFIMECIEQNKRLNAVLETHFDRAFQHAGQLDKQLEEFKNKLGDGPELLQHVTSKMPFFGVPLSLKDLLEFEGSDCTSGLLRLCGDPKKRDGEVVQIMLAAGCVPFVKTSAPQLNMLPECYNKIIGHSKNPHDLTRTPGGSSGGEGALIGSKASVLGIGTDIGGSLRIPGHFCGVMAYKPCSRRTVQRGRIGTVGPYECKHTIRAATGPMARSVDDVVTFMKLWFNNGPAWDPYMAPTKFRDDIYGYQIGMSPQDVKAQQKKLLASGRKLKVGFYYNDGWMSSTEPVRRAIDKVIGVLEKDLGYECVRLKSMNQRGMDLVRMYIQYMGAEGNLKDYMRALNGEPLLGGLETLRKASYIPNWLRTVLIRPILRSVGEHRVEYLAKINKNGGFNVKQLRDIQYEIEKFRYEFYDEYKDCDLFLSPVCFYPAMPLNWSEKVITSVTATFLQNILDCAACSFGPVTFVRESECHYDADVLNLPEIQRDSWSRLFDQQMRGAKGLPVSVQLFSKPYQDELVLRVMKELEAYIQPNKLDKQKEMMED